MAKSPNKEDLLKFAKEIIDWALEDIEIGPQNLKRTLESDDDESGAPVLKKIKLSRNDGQALGVASQSISQNLSNNPVYGPERPFVPRVTAAKIVNVYSKVEKPPHVDDIFLDWLKTDENFEPWYRARQSTQDELLRTSMMREFYTVFKAEIKAKENTYIGDEARTSKLNLFNLELNRILDNVSRLRIPTKNSGFAQSGADDYNQHTAPRVENSKAQKPYTRHSGVIEGNFAMQVGKHNKLDVERETKIFTAMKEAWKNRDSLEDVFQAAIREATLYTATYFTGPLAADDVYPHSEIFIRTKLAQSDPRHLSDSQAEEIIDEQNEYREWFKGVGVEHGVPQAEPIVLDEQTGNPLTEKEVRDRSWRTNNPWAGQKQMSPSRKVEDVELSNNLSNRMPAIHSNNLKRQSNNTSGSPFDPLQDMELAS